MSDEDEEGRALMIKPGTSTVREEKENDAFFKKVKSCNLIQQSSHPFAFYNDLLSVSSCCSAVLFSWLVDAKHRNSLLCQHEITVPM